MVYVDMLVDYGWKYGASCHLMADTQDELHSFALKIGMKRSWFQSPEKHHLPHYDLTASRKKLAVKLGAIELKSWREAADKMQELRKINN